MSSPATQLVASHTVLCRLWLRSVWATGILPAGLCSSFYDRAGRTPVRMSAHRPRWARVRSSTPRRCNWAPRWRRAKQRQLCLCWTIECKGTRAIQSLPPFRRLRVCFQRIVRQRKARVERSRVAFNDTLLLLFREKLMQFRCYRWLFDVLLPGCSSVQNSRRV